MVGTVGRLVARPAGSLLVDGVLAVVLLVVALAEVGLDDDSAEGSSPAVRTALLVAMSAVIVFRRRYPVGVWLTSGVLVTVYGVTAFPTRPCRARRSSPSAGGCARRHGRRAGRLCSRPWSCSRASSSILEPTHSIGSSRSCRSPPPDSWATTSAPSGRLPPRWRARADRLGASSRRKPGKRSRKGGSRLARELHDVAAHMWKCVAPCRGGPGDASGTSSLPAAFGTIGEAARATLADLRRGRRAADDAGAPLEPAPGLDDLDALVAEFRGGCGWPSPCPCVASAPWAPRSSHRPTGSCRRP